MALTSFHTSDLKSKLQWMMLSRLVLLGFLLGGSIVLRYQTHPASQAFDYLYSMIGLLFASSVVYLILLRSLTRFEGLAWTQVHLDVLFVTAIIFFTGGAGSIFQFLYLLIIVGAAVLLGGRCAFFCASLSSILYGLLVNLQFYGVVTPIYLEPQPQPIANALELLIHLATHISAFFAVAFLTSYLTAQLSRTQKALQERTEDVDKLSALNEWILGSIDSGLLTVGKNGRVLSWNSAAERISGYPFEAVVGESFERLFPQFAAVSVEETKDSIGNLPSRHETSVIKKNGEPVQLGFSVSPLESPDGTRYGTTVIFQDITQIKEYQSKVKRLERLAMMGRLAAGMAHEIRNPLGSMSGALQILRQEKTEPTLSRRLMSIIDREMSRLNKLLDEFLWLSKPQKIPDVLKPIDPLPVVDETITLLKSRLDQETGIRFVKDVQPDIRLSMFEDHFRQLVWNLMLNAVEASRNGGDVRVAIGANSNVPGGSHVQPSVRIEVEDHGEGMSREVVQQIFDPFFTTRPKGTGLGLAVVQSTVEHYGGNIEVQAREGEGTLFRITLPNRAKPDETNT
ncbi:MAG: PAS domain S-box protein [Deltaproteobacteria bacterium]|nr:PAS domain S-box protein [Deltaproteobacteria bacterium]